MKKSATQETILAEGNDKKKTRKRKPNQSLLASGLCSGEVYTL